MLLNKYKILYLIPNVVLKNHLNYAVMVRVVCPPFLLFCCCRLPPFKLFVAKQCFVDLVTVHSHHVMLLQEVLAQVSISLQLV